MYEVFATLAFWICILLTVLAIIISGIYIAAWLVDKICISIDKMLSEEKK